MAGFSPDEAAAWSGGRWVGEPPAYIGGIETDTRRDVKDRLFVALRGASLDGHAFAAPALAAGAAAVMVDEPFHASTRITGACLVVPDTASGLSRMASGYRDTWAAPVVAITGSTGKTSVKEMTADLLDAAGGPVARTRGNWNNHIGLPLSMLAADRSMRVGVFELGMNHPGELRPLCDILRPGIGVVTNVSAAHAEFFPSVDAIAEEKATVLRAIPPDGICIVPAEDPRVPILCKGVRGRITTVGTGEANDYSAVRREGRRFLVRERSSGDCVELETAMPGAHVVHNAMLAIAVARHLGVGWAGIEQALRACRPGRMRWEVIGHAGRTIVNDAYNANPASMAAALQTLAEMPAQGRRWAVLGGMRELGERSERDHRDIGRQAASAGLAGLLGVGPYGAMILDGAHAAGFTGELRAAEDPREAALMLEAHTAVGDLILLKGSRSERLEDVLAAWRQISGG